MGRSLSLISWSSLKNMNALFAFFASIGRATPAAPFPSLAGKSGAIEANADELGTIIAEELIAEELFAAEELIAQGLVAEELVVGNRRRFFSAESSSGPLRLRALPRI
jgi:hypothetical protein